jgi:tryptophan synthase beta subunit
MGPGRRILVNLSGRGDKDVQTVTRQLGIEEE